MGVTVVVILFTATETMDTPAVKQANEMMAKYHPETKPGYWCYLGIAGAKAFVEGARRAGPGSTWRLKLLDALYSLGRFDAGVVPPVTWSKQSHGGPTTFGWAVWKNGKLTVAEGWVITPSEPGPNSRSLHRYRASSGRSF